MKTVLPLLFAALLLVSCETVQPVGHERHVIDIPQKINQKEYFPDSSMINYYFTQSILFAELGSRFFVRDEVDVAKRYFNLAITYDEHNPKALFALGISAYREGRVGDALKYFKMIDPHSSLYPYDIDYYLAAKMFTDNMPLKPSVISLTRNDRSDIRENVIIINKGKNNGVLPKMRFKVLRIGNLIRDYQSLEVLGVQKTAVAEVSVLELDDANSVCRIDKIEPGFFIQINDSLESIVE